MKHSWLLAGGGGGGRGGGRGGSGEGIKTHKRLQKKQIFGVDPFFSNMVEANDERNHLVFGWFKFWPSDFVLFRKTVSQPKGEWVHFS